MTVADVRDDIAVYYDETDTGELLQKRHVNHGDWVTRWLWVRQVCAMRRRVSAMKIEQDLFTDECHGDMLPLVEWSLLPMKSCYCCSHKCLKVFLIAEY